MAPKPAKARSAASGRSSGSQKLVAKDMRTKKEASQGPTSEWLACPPKICRSCDQSTHMLDRDCLEGQEHYLIWKKACKNSQGQMIPTGSECYKCFDVRRKYFGMSQEDLLKKRQTREVEDKCVELRIARVRGYDSYARTEFVDCDTIVKKNEADYDDRYEEGTFMELWAWARKRNLKFSRPDEEDLLKEHVRSLGFNLTQDKAGVVGVEILDHEPGTYRFRRGKRDEISKSKEESYKKAGDKSIVSERYQALCEKQRQQRGGAATLGMQGSQQHGIPSPVASEDEQDEDDDDDVGGDSVPSTVVRGPLQLPQTQRPPSVSGSVAAPIKRDRAENSESSVVIAAYEFPSPRRSTKRACNSSACSDKQGSEKKKKIAKEVTLEAVDAILEKASQEFSWEAHWQMRGRKRDFDNFVSRVQGKGRQCGAFLDDEQALVKSQRCFSVADNLEARQTLFDKLRNDFVQAVVEPMPTDEMKIMKAGPPGLVGTIMTQCLQGLVDRMLTQPGACRAMCVVMLCKEEAEQTHLNLSLVAQDHVELAEQAQRGVLLTFAEKVMKGMDRKVVTSVLLEMDEHLPDHDSVALMEITRLKPDTLLGNGWFMQSWVDALCLRICGQVLKLEATGTPPSRVLRRRCAEIKTHAKLLSSRLKSLFKTINGSQSQHGRIAWEAIQRLSDTQSLSSLFDATTLKNMREKCGTLRGLLQDEQWSPAYNFVVDWLNDDMDLLDKFGEAFGGEDGDDCNEEASVVAKDIGHLVSQAVERAMKSWNDSDAGVVQNMFGQAWMLEGLQQLRIEGDEDEDARSNREVDLLLSLKTMMETLRRFVVGRAQSVVQQCLQRMAVVEEVFMAWSKYANEPNFGVALDSWAKAWALQQAFDEQPISSTMPLPNTGDCMERLKKIMKLEEMICFFLEETIGPDSAASRALLPTSLNKMGLLPASAGNVVGQVQVLSNLRGAAESLATGKETTGLLELTSLMSAVTKVCSEAKRLISFRPSFAADLQQVQAQWRSLFSSQLQKSKCLDAVGKFLHQYRFLNKAVESWDFQECPWLYKSSTPADDAQAKKMEQIVVQMPTWQSILRKMLAESAWMDQSDEGDLRAAAQELDKVEAQSEEVRKTLATLMLTSLIVKAEKGQEPIDAGSGPFAACLKYTSKVLFVPTLSLHANLASKLQTGTVGSHSGAASAGDAASTEKAAKGGKKLRKVF